MEYTETEIEGVWVIQPKVFDDARGYFFEAWKQAEFDAHIGYHVEFVQDNESMSSRGVLRGLHYQKGESSQAKLVRVIKGKVLDVAVDLRKDSKTFGKYVMVELSGENKLQFFIPRGFAHGFLVLSDEAIFTYKVDNPLLLKLRQVSAGMMKPLVSSGLLRAKMYCSQKKTSIRRCLLRRLSILSKIS